jgi:dethiobiotin synthetase
VTGLFVTGTDTGVGKTVVTAGIVAALRARGHDAGVAKPLQSGALADAPSGDAMLLRKWSGVEDPAHEISPYSFAPALAPTVAAELEGRSVTLEEAVDAVRAIAAKHDAVVVEGAGGLVVPLGPDWTVADLAAELGLPVLVVARAGLGTVNHSALTVHAARSFGLEPVGVVMNGPVDDSSERNAAMIEQLAHVRVLGHTPQLDGDLDAERVRELIEENIDVGALADAAIHPKEVARV